MSVVRCPHPSLVKRHADATIWRPTSRTWSGGVATCSYVQCIVQALAHVHCEYARSHGSLINISRDEMEHGELWHRCTRTNWEG